MGGQMLSTVCSSFFVRGCRVNFPCEQQHYFLFYLVCCHLSASFIVAPCVVNTSMWAFILFICLFIYFYLLAGWFQLCPQKCMVSINFTPPQKDWAIFFMLSSDLV